MRFVEDGDWFADCPVALEFALADGCLRIVNGLDENRIETGAAQPEYVRHRLGR
ncbi:hypothetical protein AB0O18_31415 [Streptomyces sp. NPDC093224]|uniref:hypothetical protein n=1 Tax=Streptomyces sp. NPDC093224 TaxID=3155198 RepID=UPI00344A4A1D